MPLMLFIKNLMVYITKEDKQEILNSVVKIREYINKNIDLN